MFLKSYYINLTTFYNINRENAREYLRNPYIDNYIPKHLFKNLFPHHFALPMEVR